MPVQQTLSGEYSRTHCRYLVGLAGGEPSAKRPSQNVHESTAFLRGPTSRRFRRHDTPKSIGCEQSKSALLRVRDTFSVVRGTWAAEVAVAKIDGRVTPILRQVVGINIDRIGVELK